MLPQSTGTTAPERAGELQASRWTSPAAIALFLAAIAVIEYLIFFSNPSHFFQGDSVFLLSHRPLSLVEFLRNFWSIDSSGRYRPIGNWLVPFIFYRWFGLNPVGYRIVGFIVFFAVTAAVFLLVRDLTRSRIATYAATLFFAIHTVGAWISYDIAFITEAMFALFYIGSAILYLRYLRSSRRADLLLSIALFVGALLSKETSVTLPATLVALALFENGFNWKALTGMKWHAALAAGFLLFSVLHLGVYRDAFVSLGTSPASVKGGGYHFILDPHGFLFSADEAFTWAFNLPRGPDALTLPHWSMLVLKGFRLAVAVLAIVVLFPFRVARPTDDPPAQNDLSLTVGWRGRSTKISATPPIFGFRRRWLLLGLAWFMIALGPPLLLLGHFTQYYLFCPLAGFSLAVGACVDWLYGRLEGYSAALANVACFAPFVPLMVVCVMSIQANVRDNRLLGYSSRADLDSVTAVRSRYPEFKPKSTLYIIEDEDPGLQWDDGLGGVFSLMYQNPPTVLYSGGGQIVQPGGADPLVVFRLDKGKLQEITDDFKTNPVSYLDYIIHFVDGPYRLKFDRSEVTAGADSYTLMISGMSDKDVRIHYSINQGPLQSFDTHLDSEGKAHFDVAWNTPKGVYRFIGFHDVSVSETMRSDAVLTVR